MRTKTLLLTAAIAVASIGASVAQTVYSVNAVGYVNLSLQGAFTMIANPLNQTNNLLSTVLPAPPDGTQILKWDNATQNFQETSQFFDGLGWIPDNSLSPGEGAFVSLPAPATLTFVGEVPQGVLSNNIPINFSIVSMQTPQSIDLTTAGFPAVDGDQILFWDNATQNFKETIQYFDGLGWLPDPNPTPAVGESFFVSKTVASAWVRTFSVN
jgi:hypothetical protein